MSAAAQNRQFPFAGAAILWAGLLLFGTFGGLWLGYGGRRFAVAMVAATVLLGGELFLASPRTRDRILGFLRGRGFFLAALAPLCAFLLYALAGREIGWVEAGAGVLYVVIPALLAASARGKSTSCWEDYAALLMIWLPVEFRWMYRLWPFPHELTHTLTILFAVNTAIAVFLAIRRFDGVGYGVEWRRGFGWAVAINFLFLAVIIIPLGEAIHFIHYGPTLHSLKATPLTGLEILVFTAWPEEFLFRGLLQNLLSRSMKNRYAGWVVASVIFGFSHILHAPAPNWKYVFLATIAGLFYGRAWMKTESLFPSAIVHALVDTIWFGFFPR
ncbi:MAG TPA: type II CAAX endopeptidase family protein [Candidatus Acidoferrales bacterium]|nr:type II CAAX endopeptidase family protein [Candidatus Acidoferrales bacterium]